MLDSPSSSAQAQAATLLQELQTRFVSATAAVARACTRAGRLDAALLDEQQGACFELSWAKAELQAAVEIVSSDGLSPLQRELGLAFVTDAIGSVLRRLESVSIDMGEDLLPLQRVACAPEFIRLRRAADSSSTLARLGHAVIESPDELALRSTHDDVAIACESFARFAAERVAPLAQDIHRQDLTVPESLLTLMREMGAFGLSIPEEFGGSANGGPADSALMIAVTEVLSEASLAAAGSLITRPEILARALLAGGTSAQQSHWLPRIASGELLCAIAITEPDYGSDVAGLVLAATPAEGGWRLNGAKAWCTFAGKAGLLMVVARTNRDRSLGHKGLSVMLVEKPSFDTHEFHYAAPGGGSLAGRAIPTIGYRGMHSFDLVFDDFFVPAMNVVGEEGGVGKGFYFTMAGMTGGRLQTAGRACGVMRAAIKAASEYALNRKVFGAPLADYALTKIKLARMAARYLACRQLAEATGRGADRPTHAMEASLAKLLACRCAELVTREALQIHGAMGYAEETPVSRLFVDARVLSIFEGAEETLALKVIARSLLEAAVQTVKEAQV
jgi:(2S)-methylsuccinyl-CoA dehydrogenase